MTRQGVIYLLTFANGKQYVGQTINNIEQRMRGHASSARKDNPRLPVHKAWAHHGKPDLLILVELPEEQLSPAEVFFISLIGTLSPKGYNCTIGGERSPMLMPEIVAKVRALASTPERVARNREIHLGSKRSLETRLQMSIDRKGKSISKQTPEHVLKRVRASMIRKAHRE